MWNRKSFMCSSSFTNCCTSVVDTSAPRRIRNAWWILFRGNDVVQLFVVGSTCHPWDVGQNEIKKKNRINFVLPIEELTKQSEAITWKNLEQIYKTRKETEGNFKETANSKLLFIMSERKWTQGNKYCAIRIASNDYFHCDPQICHKQFHKDFNNNLLYHLFISRGHPGLNRGQSDLQSDALPLSYAPCYVMIWCYKIQNDVQNPSSKRKRMDNTRRFNAISYCIK
jgi:hypothetical protein